MKSIVRSTALIAAFASLGLGALILCEPVFAHSPDSGGGSGSSACKKYKTGSKEWKQCMGQARQDLEDTYALGYWMAKTGEYEDALKVLKSASDQNDPRVLTMIGFATRHLGHVDEALLQAGEPAKAKEQLNEIAKRCGMTCDDYQQLASAIAVFERGRKT